MNKLNLIAQKRIPLVLMGLFALLALFGIILFKLILEASWQSSDCPPSMMTYWGKGESKPPRLIDMIGANDATCINCPEVVAAGRIDGALS